MKRIITLMSFCLFAGIMLNGQALKVAASGNVGIDQGTPTEKLHLTDGKVKITGTSGAAHQILVDVADNRAGFQLKNNSGDFAVFTSRGDFGDAVFSVFDASMNRFNEAFKYDYVNRALNVQGTIASNGSILTSDKNLKTNVQKFQRGLDAVLELRPISYEYTGKLGTTAGKHHVGVFAQNLQDVAPEFVVEQTYQGYDQNMDKNNDAGDYLAIKDNEVKWLLVNAIKDQQEIINSQEERIERLEELVQTLVEKGNSSLIELNGQQDGASINQNTPNPFNASTEIGYVIPTSAKSASMKIYGLDGTLLRTENITHTGSGVLKIQTNDLPSGTYVYNLEVDGKQISSKKMIKAR